MQRWSDYLDKLRKGAEVVPLKTEIDSNEDIPLIKILKGVSKK